MRLYLMVVTIILMAAGTLGWSTRHSFQDDTSVQSYFTHASRLQISYDDDDLYLHQYFQNNLNTLSKLRSNADLVVKVRVTPKRVNMMKAIKSQVEVLHVYQGHGVTDGDTIQVYEPSSFSTMSYFVTGNWNVMQEGKEYILFLQHLKVPKGYHYKGDESKTYVPVSTCYGKFPVSPGITGQVLPDLQLSHGMRYSVVKDYDLITTDAKVFQVYAQLKAEVLRMN